MIGNTMASLEIEYDIYTQVVVASIEIRSSKSVADSKEIDSRLLSALSSYSVHTNDY